MNRGFDHYSPLETKVSTGSGELHSSDTYSTDFIQLRARHRTVSPGDASLAHGPARPDPSPLCAQTPRTAPCDAFPRRYVDRRVHDRPPPFRTGASSRDGRLTPAQMGNAR